MKIAVASGKGGTGKTTLATNLAYTAGLNERNVTYLDCDVEEPNGAIFLKPTINKQEPIERLVPVIDKARCTFCGQCEQICQFSAVVLIKQSILIYPEMCHACGGCSLACPTGAVIEQAYQVGNLEIGRSGNIDFIQGILNIGEMMSPPIIHAVRKAAPKDQVTIIDAPPGTSCPMISAIQDVDYVVLITEPTPFGLHDLDLAVEAAEALRLPYGVVINQWDSNDEIITDYCQERKISILAKIPADRKIAEAYSRGKLIAQALPGYQDVFQQILRAIAERFGQHQQFERA